MGENNNKPIGFTHRDRPYGVFGILSGHMRLHFQQKNFPYGVYRSGLGPPRSQADLSTGLGRIWGLFWESRSLRGGLHNTVRGGRTISGKIRQRRTQKKSMEKIGKYLTFSKFRLFRLLSAGSRPPLPLYHTSLQKSIGKMHKKSTDRSQPIFYIYLFLWLPSTQLLQANTSLEVN